MEHHIWHHEAIELPMVLRRHAPGVMSYARGLAVSIPPGKGIFILGIPHQSRLGNRAARSGVRASH